MKQSSRHRTTDQRPLVKHAPERVAFSITAAEISDYTAALVPAVTDRLATPGEAIVQARQVRKLGLDLLTRAVLLERVLGRSWTQIAAALGETEEWTRGRWVPVEQEWLRDDKFEDRQRTLDDSLLLPHKQVPTTEDEVRKAAEVLDEWCRSHSDPTFPRDGEKWGPVSEGIVAD